MCELCIMTTQHYRSAVTVSAHNGVPVALHRCLASPHCQLLLHEGTNVQVVHKTSIPGKERKNRQRTQKRTQR
jgi:hypothetical protein